MNQTDFGGSQFHTDKDWESPQNAG